MGDVWLGNSRGNVFSAEHELLDMVEDEPEYWNFSFPELGMYDLTAMLSMVKEETGKKINYIGYSLGTTELFYAMSSTFSKDIIEENIQQAVALAPVFIPNVSSLVEINQA